MLVFYHKITPAGQPERYDKDYLNMSCPVTNMPIRKGDIIYRTINETLFAKLNPKSVKEIKRSASNIITPANQIVEFEIIHPIQRHEIDIPKPSKINYSDLLSKTPAKVKKALYEIEKSEYYDILAAERSGENRMPIIIYLEKLIAE